MSDETNDTTALALRPSSVQLMPAMDIRTAIDRLDQLASFCANYLKEGASGNGDYGILPGTDRKTLYKSGADKLCDIYAMSDEYKIIEQIVDYDRGLFDYTVECRLSVRGDGSFIGSGVGSCTSFESRYRWRKAERVCPQCGKPAIIKGKSEFGGGFVCFKKKDGCGAKFADNDPDILGQVVGRIENPDIADQKNTVLKMACKRAKVAAVIAATRSSGLFTQDLEDFVDAEYTVHDDAPKAVPPAPAPRPTAAVPAARPTAVAGRADGESQADYVARVKAAQASQAAPGTTNATPVDTQTTAKVDAPQPTPAAVPPPGGSQAPVLVTAVNSKSGPVPQGGTKPAWGPLFVVTFNGKVRASNGELVSDASTLDQKLAERASAIKDVTPVVPEIVPGSKKGTFRLVSLPDAAQ